MVVSIYPTQSESLLAWDQKTGSPDMKDDSPVNTVPTNNGFNHDFKLVPTGFVHPHYESSPFPFPICSPFSGNDAAPPASSTGSRGGHGSAMGAWFLLRLICELLWHVGCVSARLVLWIPVFLLRCLVLPMFGCLLPRFTYQCSGTLRVWVGGLKVPSISPSFP